MIRSDYQSWVLLSSGQMSLLSPVEIYKSCVISANNGIRRKEETGLGFYQQTLLETRRNMKAGRFEAATRLLSSLKSKPANSPIDRGDREFLKGMILHRVGEQQAAAEQLSHAAKVFSETSDTHRIFRALINEKISAATNLHQYLAGDLYILQNEAMQAGYHDLAGNVHCARAGELIVAGKFSEAISEAFSAVSQYRLASCPEDLAQAQMMLVIAQFLNGGAEDAKMTFSNVHIRDGKIANYVAIFEALLLGRRPMPPLGPPLVGTPWKVRSSKKASITGKISARLCQGPATRDQLIVEVWGERAIHPSYCSRLYSAINQLRKNGQQVLFDGEKYTIAR
jgi:hypothetical protein